MNSNVFARTRLFTPGVLLLVATVALLAGCGGDDGAAQQAGAAPPPVPVAVQTVKPGPVDVYATYPGRIRGAREVQVLARVEGVLLKRHYNEGEFVDKGELLITIDPETLKATVKQRDAELSQAEAQLNQAQQVWQRVSRLYEVNAISEAERDQAKADLQTGRAAVELAQANLEAAQIQLDYTTVEAPLSGVTSLQEIDEGALVTHGTLLTTVTQMNPVHVLFSVPAEDAMMREKALAAMVEGDGATRQARLVLPGGKTYPEAGMVDFTQSTIDPSTGTVRLRAVFDNDDHMLVPGRFVSVRIRLETRDSAVVVPDESIADSEQMSMVYLVTDDNKIKPAPVVLGPSVEGGRIIEQGLKPGDRVVTIGLGSVRPGSAVKVVPASELALGGQPGGQAANGGDAAADAESTSQPEQGGASTQQSDDAGKQDN